MFKPPYAEPLTTLIARLTPKQWEAYAYIRVTLPGRKFSFKAAESPDVEMMLLTGYAGAGKTFLLHVLARAAREEASCSVCLCAPTHKAVAVLADKVPGFPTMTVAKLTGKKASGYDDEGSRIFTREEKGQGSIFNYVIVDESSMLAEDTLLEIIDSVAPGGSILFVGDPAQLPPVMPGVEDTSLISPVFGLMGGVTHQHLDGIVRQAEGNPIIQAADSVRTMIDTGTYSVDWTQAGWSHDTGGIALMARPEAYIAAKEAFLSDEFRENANAYRVVAYTNHETLEWNWTIRDWLFPDKNIRDTLFFPGELAVVNEAYAPKDEIILQNNEEVRILEAVPHTRILSLPEHHGPDGAKLCDAFETHLPGFNVQTTPGASGQPVAGFVPAHYTAWKAIDTILRNQAKACKGVKYTRGFERFQFNADILHLRHNYALTVHKAQGSTFDNVLLPYYDLTKARRSPADTPYFGRLLYTALTRARKTVGVAQ